MYIRWSGVLGVLDTAVAYRPWTDFGNLGYQSLLSLDEVDVTGMTGCEANTGLPPKLLLWFVCCRVVFRGYEP